MPSLKTIGFGALGLLLVIVLLQNTHRVDIKFLTWEITINQIFLIPILLAIGFGAGFVAAVLRDRGRSPE